MSQEERLYHELAKYYDQIYYWKDYESESVKIKKLIQKHKRSSGNALLDVACGTGKHLQHLVDDFDCVGVDISEEMLQRARKNVPEAKLVKGNMEDFDLARRFDVVICLFSSIGYLRTRTEVRLALSNFTHHLKGGGVLIVEPWFRESEWEDRSVHLRTFEGKSLKIARVSFARKVGMLSVMDERFLIAEEGRGITYVKDHQRMRLFELEWTLEVMRRLGLKASFTEEGLMPGRGLLIATRSQE